jgi:hypothetical protein
MINQYINSAGELVIVPMSEADMAQRAIDEANWQAGEAQRERDAHNAPIIAALEANDKRAIRAMRDNEEDMILQLREEAAALREQLI